MESTLCISTAKPTMLPIYGDVNCLFTNRVHSFHLPSQLASRLVVSSLYSCQRLPPLTSSISSSSVPLRGSCAAVPLLRRRLECVSNSAASFGTSGGGSGGEGAGGGGGAGGDGSSNGGECKPNLVAGPAEDMSVLSSDVIVLDVGGMICGGCAASVKRILESQPQVSSASVNLTTATAIVWPVSEAKEAPNWQKQLGETLARHVTSCGFKSNLRVTGPEAVEGDVSP